MKIIIIGQSGRMGKTIQSICEASKDLAVVAGVSQGGDIPSPKHLGETKADVVIDFSLPEVFDETLKWCRSQKVPLVSGTTGLSEKQLGAITEASQNIPILWSSNMSLGVAFVNSLLNQFSALKSDFDFQIEEFHHKHKKDKPSGTAIDMKKNLDKALGFETPEVLAARGGGIFGVHKVWAMSEEETIQIEHTALNRDVFAKGALTAARWLKAKPPGEYKISQVLSE